ncbi:MAG: hypothetical protein K2N47_00695 [Clostridia bacterium]|nr:hypothetical protein [Clostridia bacterium]
MKNKIIRNDINRYKKNKLPGTLALLAIVFQCLYFMFMYKQTAGNIKQLFQDGTPVYTYLIGISVVLNLVMLLAIFLTSEEIKGYSKKFSIVALVLGGIQIIRIFGYPLYSSTHKFQYMSKTLISAGTCTLLIVLIVLSAACLIAAGVLGIITSSNLSKYKKDLEAGKIDLEGALKEEETPVTATVEANTASDAGSVEVK